MKAAQITEYGDATKVHVNKVDKPIITKAQVLVRVYASSLSPTDTGFRTGWMEKIMPLHFPATLGGDIAGEVVEVGTEVGDFAIGDKVYGQAYTIFGNSGAFAEYSAVNAGQIARMPQNTDFIEAGSLPLIGVSAVQALEDNAKLQSEQKILIHGGSGGIGSIAISIAKHLGAHVATTVSGVEAREFVKGLGADEVIDYKTEHFEDMLKDYDVVLDLVGGETFKNSVEVLKPGGTIVTLNAMLDDAVGEARDLGYKVIFQITKVETGILNRLSRLVESGVIKAYVAKTYSLEDTQAAFVALESKSHIGKIVIKID